VSSPLESAKGAHPSSFPSNHNTNPLDHSTSSTQIHKEQCEKASNPTFEETIHQLFKPIIHPDFFQDFTNPTGKVFSHNISTWTQPLGKDLLIVDVDTRYPEQIFNTSQLVDWANLDHTVTEAVFNHHLYGTYVCISLIP
jgi:hypothetical protein